jgi:hypothetical protein
MAAQFCFRFHIYQTAAAPTTAAVNNNHASIGASYKCKRMGNMRNHTIVVPGALHMHTTFSDGTGTVEQVVAAAQAAGLRWIIITDHDTLAGLPYAGWHGDLLVIVGHEITPDRNHFLALNIASVVDREQPPQQFIDAVYAAGGFGIIAHPDEQVRNPFKDIYRWDDWQIDGPSERAGKPVGIELWNLMSDWGESINNWNAPLQLAVPRLGIRGPTTATLAWWDRLNMAGRRTFGVGGVDAHAFRRRLPWGTVEIFPYRWIFGTLTNYLLLDEPLSRDAYHATNQVYAALTGGRSYFVNRLDGPGDGVQFAAQRGGEHYRIGDTASLAGGPLLFSADAGCNALLRLIGNGKPLASGVRTLRQSIAIPGVYRLEGYWGGKSWLYSNPIYVEQ